MLVACAIAPELSRSSIKLSGMAWAAMTALVSTPSVAVGHEASFLVSDPHVHLLDIKHLNGFANAKTHCHYHCSCAISVLQQCYVNNLHDGRSERKVDC